MSQDRLWDKGQASTRCEEDIPQLTGTKLTQNTSQVGISIRCEIRNRCEADIPQLTRTTLIQKSSVTKRTAVLMAFNACNMMTQKKLIILQYVPKIHSF